MDRRPYAYLIGWPERDTYYIGARYAQGCVPSDLWRTYFTSSRKVTAMRYLYGEPSIFKIVEWPDKQATLNAERCMILKCNAVADGRFLNQACYDLNWYTGSDWTGRRHTQATKDKISASHKRREPASEETRNKLSAALKGNPRSEEWRENLSNAKKGRPNGLLGKKRKPVSDETKAKISAALRARFNK